ncbi:MAG: hypothetical protein ACUVQV_06645 [Dissulfurimicrobium sp.]|uniref:hypothetical protein n=1 Tax=Dissulfurimicrobium sp. TaxID=2022436 RepID=UPI00404B4120
MREVKTRWPDTDIIFMTDFIRDFSYLIKRLGLTILSKSRSAWMSLRTSCHGLYLKERELRHRIESFLLETALQTSITGVFFDKRLEEEVERASR